ncbi:proprotein convertase P-domain-containing protein, partial [uncultured Tenacibaculum sp.]
MGENYIAKIGTYKKAFFFVLTVFLSAKSFSQDCTIYSDNDNYNIPDNTSSYSDYASVTISDSFSIVDLDVNISITHTYNSDLRIRLVHRVGGVINRAVDLSINRDGQGDGFSNVTFDESSSTSLPNGGNNNTLTGTYNPDGNLDDFVGDNSLGDWVLQIRDDLAGDTGTLTSFSINICKLHEVSCNDVYASSSSSILGNRNSLYTLTGSTMTPVYTAPQRIGGLAISADGNAYYDDASASFPLYSSDGSTQVSEGATLPNQLVGQGANADGDVYYIDTSYHLRVIEKGSGTATDLGALNFGTDTIGDTLVAGDLAFDGNGRLHWYASVGGSGASYLFIINTNTLVAQNLGNVGPNGATGVAFDSSGNMITSTSNGDGTSNIYSIDFSSPTLSGTFIGTASPGVYDMGSCSTPTYNPILSATKSVKNITKSADPAVIALSGDVLEYTIVVNNTGNLSASNTTFIDAIPASTTYVANSTQLNGVSIADVGGNMPYTTATEIHSSTQPDGVVTIGSPVTITFRVTVDYGRTLPATINNTGTVEYPIVTGGVTTNQSVDSNTVSTPTGDICTLGINDSDGDGIDDVCDLDDDNDGILDVNEGLCTPSQSGSWTVSGTTATYDYGNGVIARVTTTDADSFTNDSFNNQSFWSETLGGDTSLAGIFDFGTSLTVSFEDSLGNPVEVKNPTIHLDKIGGSDGVNQNSAMVTLQGGLTWQRLAGTSDFLVTSNTVTDGGAGTPISGWSAESTANDSDGTAAGSLRIFGTISTFTLNFTQNGDIGLGADGIELILFACENLDTDFDGIPDYLDTDSDNDVCFDAIEGDENVLTSHLNPDGSINFAANGGVDANGVPNLVNASGAADGGNNTQGQGITGNEIVATQIQMDTQPSDSTICFGSNVTFTAAASSLSTTSYTGSAPSTTPDYSSSTATTTGLVYQWQEQVAGSGSWNDISNGGIYSNATTPALTLTNPPITVSTNKYRLIVTSTLNTCQSLTSDEVSLTIIPTSVGGSIAGSTNVCTGTNSTILTLSGQTGNIIRWESSTDNFTTDIDIANTTTTLTATNLTTTTQYRAIVQSGACTEATSATATITVDPTSEGGSIAGSTNVCT